MGIDYDTGFPSFFGSVPDDPSATGRAASLICQGKVEASPLAMAGVVASVTAGKTVLPHLIEGQVPKSKAKPLTADEAGGALVEVRLPYHTTPRRRSSRSG